MIDKFNETRHLVKLQVFYDGKNAYSFNYEGKVHVFRGTVEELAKFLQSFKAKDNKTNPRSHRGEKYIDIANEITDGSDNIIFAWSNDIANTFNKREEVMPVKEHDELFLTGASFKSSGLYDKIKDTYNESWAKAILQFADDKACQKAGFFLMCDESYTFLEIRKINKFNDWIAFMVNKSGENPGTFIKFGFNGVFSQDFAKSKIITYLGLENDALVIKAGSTCLHTLEDIQESVTLTKDGAVINNLDGALLTDLFSQLKGDPRWKVDEDHRRCTRTDGTYFSIKGNMIECGTKSGVFISLPWTKEIEFTLTGDGRIKVRFEINAAGPGRFVL